MKIPFNKPCIIGDELKYISRAVSSGGISGDGVFTKKCSEFIQDRYGVKKALLTTSCSISLDMSAILSDIKPGDEVILPSFTFVSTANSFLIRGARPVFVDVRSDTLNIDENKIEEAITSKTKVIVVVHYAGVSCEMEKILSIGKKYGLLVVEDSANGMEAKYRHNYLGTMGDIGCYSFHETKNITCGEGGAILINNDRFAERAEIIREKGTNRSKFFRGEVDKYNWIDIGSSYLPSDILSAFLYAQLENIDLIIKKRMGLWRYYYDNLEEMEINQILRRPVVPDGCLHNGQLFYILLEEKELRGSLLTYLKARGIQAVFHYLPLHLSPVGKSLGYRGGQLKVTEDVSERLVRLPLYYTLTGREQDIIIENLNGFFRDLKKI